MREPVSFILFLPVLNSNIMQNHLGFLYLSFIFGLFQLTSGEWCQHYSIWNAHTQSQLCNEKKVQAAQCLWELPDHWPAFQTASLPQHHPSSGSTSVSQTWEGALENAISGSEETHSFFLFSWVHTGMRMCRTNYNQPIYQPSKDDTTQSLKLKKEGFESKQKDKTLPHYFINGKCLLYLSFNVSRHLFTLWWKWNSICSRLVKCWCFCACFFFF